MEVSFFGKIFQVCLYHEQGQMKQLHSNDYSLSRPKARRALQDRYSSNKADCPVYHLRITRDVTSEKETKAGNKRGYIRSKGDNKMTAILYHVLHES